LHSLTRIRTMAILEYPVALSQKTNDTIVVFGNSEPAA
jgi:hypothetical protein